MKLKRVRIENYRSIQTVDFTVPGLCPVIGGNNSGKSNVLKAIHLILGDAWPSVRVFDEKDLYAFDGDRQISICLWFDQVRMARGTIGDPAEFTGIRFNVRQRKKAHGKYIAGDLMSEFYCIDDEGEAVRVLMSRPGRKAGYQDAPVRREFREALPSVLVDVDRNANYHLSGSRWSILGRILSRVSRQLKKDKERYREFQERFKEVRAQLETEEFKALERSIEKNMRRQTGIQGIQVSLSDLDPIDIYRSFFVSFKDPKSPVKVDAERMGAGVQSAVVIALLQAYAEMKDETALILFEEPELFLAPHGRRHLNGLLHDLSESGQQVLYTTHSEDFVDVSQVRDVRIVTADAGQGTTVTEPEFEYVSENERKRLRALQRFGDRLGEVFFADSVVLCEGPTEVAAIHHLLPLMPGEFSSDLLNCSILYVDGVTDLPRMMKVVVALKKPMLVMYDTDSDKEDEQERKAARDRIDKVLSAAGEGTALFPSDPFFEVVAGVPDPKKTRKVERMVDYISGFDAWDDVPRELQNLMEHVRTLATDSHAGGAPDQLGMDEEPEESPEDAQSFLPFA